MNFSQESSGPNLAISPHMKMISKLRNSTGQGLIEYLMLVCFITVSSIAVVSVVGANVKELYANIAHSLQGRKKIDFTPVDSSMHKARTLEDFMEGAKKPDESSDAGWKK